MGEIFMEEEESSKAIFVYIMLLPILVMLFWLFWTNCCSWSATQQDTTTEREQRVFMKTTRNTAVAPILTKLPTDFRFVHEWYAKGEETDITMSSTDSEGNSPEDRGSNLYRMCVEGERNVPVLKNVPVRKVSSANPALMKVKREEALSRSEKATSSAEGEREGERRCYARVAPFFSNEDVSMIYDE